MGDKPRVRLLPVTENMMASEEKKKKKENGHIPWQFPFPCFTFPVMISLLISNTAEEISFLPSYGSINSLISSLKLSPRNLLNQSLYLIP